MQTRPDSSQVLHNGGSLKVALDALESGGAVSAAGVGVTPVGGIASTNVQAAIAELDADKQAVLVSGNNIKTVNGQSLVGSGNIAIAGGGGASTASAVSYNPSLTTLVATDVQAAINELDTKKQGKLVSGTSIKTVNGQSILGAGDIAAGSSLIDVRVAGADNTGAADCTAIVQGLINANNSGKGFSLYFPPGKYRFNSQLVCNLVGDTSFTMVGAGSEASTLFFPSGSGIKVTYSATWWAPSPDGNSFGMSGLTLTTLTQNTGTAVQVLGGAIEGRPCQMTKFYDVGVRGETGAHVWAVAFDLASTSAAHFTNCVIYGANGTVAGDGILIRNVDLGTETNSDPVEFVVTSCRFVFLDHAIFCVGSDIEGVHVNSCLFIYVKYGVHWVSATSESALQICNSHIASTLRCIKLARVFDVSISGNSFFTAANPFDWRGVEIDHCGGSVVGNIFAGSQQAAQIGLTCDDYLGGGAGPFQGVSIVGNTFRYVPLGIALAPDVKGVFVASSNLYANGVTPYFDQSSNQNMFEKKSYQTSTARTIGTGTTEFLDVALPPWAFFERPGAGFIQVEGTNPDPNIIGFYDFTTSTKNNARFILRTINGQPLPGGVRRFSIALFEYNRFEF